MAFVLTATQINYSGDEFIYCAWAKYDKSVKENKNEGFKTTPIVSVEFERADVQIF